MIEIPTLYIIIPCYNEEEVLPITSKMFRKKLMDLMSEGFISDASKVLFVNDGSKDNTWALIKDLCKDELFLGITLSRNRGHQYAVLAGLMEAKDKCDITITIDCDGQDDVNAMDSMIKEYLSGSDIVYGVRNCRKTDTFFKRNTAQGFYKFMNVMGAEVVYNHADYRLVSSRVLNEFENYKEVNIFLRGLFPLVGFKSSIVYYERHERLAGSSHYPLRKMIALAVEGITSLSVKPLRMIVNLGLLISLVSFIFVVWCFVIKLAGRTVQGWASTISIIAFLSGVQLLCIGTLGEYIGKIYMEVKGRPRFIVSERTWEEKSNKRRIYDSKELITENIQ